MRQKRICKIHIAGGRRVEADLLRLIDDDRFRAYHREFPRPKRFNTFDVLRYSDYEIRHSNVLAWLLRPGDTHGICARFLEWFADHVNARLVSANAGSLPTIDFAAPNVDVWRERDYVDITVFFKREKCVIAIENKMGPASPEHRRQVRGYERKLRDKYKNHTVKSVLLTTSSGGSQNFPDIALVSWKSVREFVGSMLDDGAFNSSHNVRAFVRQYLDLVERWLHPTAGAGFRALLNDHRSILTELRRILHREGDDIVGGMVPDDRKDYRAALFRLVKESRQDPKELRRVVWDHLKGRRCTTGRSQNPPQTHYWLWWTDTTLAEAVQRLGGEPDSLWWEMTFTHQGVWIGFQLSQHSGEEQEERSLMDRLKHFMQDTPINRQKPEGYAMTGMRHGGDRVYHKQLLSEDDLAEMSASEVKDEVIRRLKRFMGSDESEYRRVDDYFQCLVFALVT